jgi:hypothetical protein
LTHQGRAVDSFIHHRLLNLSSNTAALTRLAAATTWRMLGRGQKLFRKHDRDLFSSQSTRMRSADPERLAGSQATGVKTTGINASTTVPTKRAGNRCSSTCMWISGELLDE